jgi:hypothetical protein
MRPESSPRALTLQWLSLLSGPVAWASAFGILFALTDENCSPGIRLPSWIVAGTALAVALLPIPFAWSKGRRSADVHRTADRACFLARVTLGLSVMFGLVILLTAIPLGMLDPCRT